ncbi:hypothetical protein [Pseudomonas sp. R45(2017)]|uniref:hypothetical protein n=1 Tax=Pseudomonas sp. R45(2017) TaxID=1981678 RepID=UPI000A1EFF2F|nr:hypothetical protein [Pseudomonas sp. R45(2017)]
MTSQNQAVATADALTLLLHQQHGIAAAVEELAKWVASQGGGIAAENALSALADLDLHGQALINAINDVRRL